jgi:3-oxoacyl-[acyl-carrier protein] reductase
MNLDLTNKNALVCGSSKGIGKAIAVELALLGANVTLVARNEDALKAAQNELDKSKGQVHEYLVADFSDAEKLNHLLNDFFTANKKDFSILINNTGGPPGGPVALASESEFLQAFNNHLLCNHVLVKAVLPGMKKSGYGRIVNVISTSVKAPLKGLGVSNTIRGAVASWAKTMANELGSFGITVNNVLPGATATDRLQSIIENKASKNNLATDTVTEEMKAEIPLGRFAEPEEIAAAAAFLCSPSGAYITGTNVVVDGGRTSCL